MVKSEPPSVERVLAGTPPGGALEISVGLSDRPRCPAPRIGDGDLKKRFGFLVRIDPPRPAAAPAPCHPYPG